MKMTGNAQRENSAEYGAAAIEVVAFGFRKLFSMSKEHAVDTADQVESFIAEVLNHGDADCINDFIKALRTCLEIVRTDYNRIVENPDHLVSISRHSALICVASQGPDAFIGLVKEEPELYRLMLDDLNGINNARSTGTTV
jgi:hypothetical protein